MQEVEHSELQNLEESSDLLETSSARAESARAESISARPQDPRCEGRRRETLVDVRSHDRKTLDVMKGDRETLEE